MSSTKILDTLGNCKKLARVINQAKKDRDSQGLSKPPNPTQIFIIEEEEPRNRHIDIK